MAIKSLFFLQYCDLKNRLLELRHKPGKLVFILFIIGLVLFFLISAIMADVPMEPSEMVFLKGILFAFFLFTFVTGLLPAFGKGLSNYGMEDVNTLFVAPIHPQTILLYGIMKALKTLFLGSFFIFFQLQWMRSAFGVGPGALIPLGFGYVLMSFVGNVLAQVIYAFTNGVPRRKNIAKVLVVLALVPVAGLFLFEMMNVGWDFWAGLPDFLGSPIVDFTPVVGWTAAGIFAFISGDVVWGLIFLGLLIGFAVVCIIVLYVKNPDFYEDTLSATETAFEVQRAAQEGDMSTAIGATGRDIKIKGTGLRGIGANVFLFKHLRESLRASRFGLWGFGSLALIIGAIVLAFFTRPDYVYEMMDWFGPLMSVTITFIFISTFTHDVSRGSVETYSHYIYMIPESAFKKWIWAHGEVMLKVIPEAIVTFASVGLILGASIGATVVAAVTYVMFKFYLCGINLAFMRIYGSKMSGGVIIFIYYVVVFVPLIPGVVAWVIIGIAFPTVVGMTIGMLVFTLWQLSLGLFCFVISKSVLHNCDMPVLTAGMVGSVG